MRIQTILNRVEKFKSFVYGRVSLENRMDGFTLVIRVKPRKNSRVFPWPRVRPPEGTAVRVHTDLGDFRTPAEIKPRWASRSRNRCRPRTSGS